MVLVLTFVGAYFWCLLLHTKHQLFSFYAGGLNLITAVDRRLFNRTQTVTVAANFGSGRRGTAGQQRSQERPKGRGGGVLDS